MTDGIEFGNGFLIVGVLTLFLFTFGTQSVRVKPRHHTHGEIAAATIAFGHGEESIGHASPLFLVVNLCSGRCC